MNLLLLSYQKTQGFVLLCYVIFTLVVLILYEASFHPIKMQHKMKTCRFKPKSHLYLLLLVINTRAFTCLALHDSLSEQVSVVKYYHVIRRKEMEC